MTENNFSPSEDLAAQVEADRAASGAVLAAVIPGQPTRVLEEAATYAELFGVPLVIVHVDTMRFVAYEDPDGYVHAASADLHLAQAQADLTSVRQTAAALFSSRDLEWSVRQLDGDPALAIKELANRIAARLIVVGTRDRGLGESIREFFTGSVAARLAHRQHRPILVVPLADAARDDEDLWVE